MPRPPRRRRRRPDSAVEFGIAGSYGTRLRCVARGRRAQSSVAGRRRVCLVSPRWRFASRRRVWDPLRRAGRPAGPHRGECVAQAGGQTLPGDRAVAQLGALVVGHDPDARHRNVPVRRWRWCSLRRRRTGDVEAQLDAGRGLVRVLAARPSGGREALLDLARGEVRPGADRQVVAHAGPSAQQVRRVHGDRRQHLAPPRG